MSTSVPRPATDCPFEHPVGSIGELEALYPSPSRLVVEKAVPTLDGGCRAFIAASPLVMIGTVGAAGTLDVSPRGGTPGFVRVLDDERLVIPDMRGNNRLDTLHNVIERGSTGLLFVIPGLGETLRVNGRAWVTTDAGILDGFEDEMCRPTSAIGVRIDEAYIHCAKAFRRGNVWDATTWPESFSRPSVGQILIDHAGIDTSVTAAQVEADLEADYVRGLAAEKPSTRR